MRAILPRCMRSLYVSEKPQQHGQGTELRTAHLRPRALPDVSVTSTSTWIPAIRTRGHKRSTRTQLELPNYICYRSGRRDRKKNFVRAKLGLDYLQSAVRTTVASPTPRTHSNRLAPFDRSTSLEVASKGRAARRRHQTLCAGMNYVGQLPLDNETQEHDEAEEYSEEFLQRGWERQMSARRKKEQGAAQLIARQNMALYGFGLPALGMFMFGPLMTLVDTAFVGLSSTTTQQAALTAGALLMDFPFMLLSFLPLVTTATVMSAANEARSTGEYADGLRGSLQRPIYLALVAGTALFTAVNALGPALLSALHVPPQVLPHALEYLDVRAWCIPLQSLSAVLQTIFLAHHNALTPFLLASAAAGVNLAGNVVACHGLGLGIAGVAYASVASQAVLLGGLLLATAHGGMLPRWGAPSVRTLLAALRSLDHFDLWRAVPRALRMMLIVGYSVQELGTVAMIAGLQITLSLYLLVDLLGESMHQTARVMLRRFAPGTARHSVQTTGMVVESLVLVATFMGAVSGAVASLVTLQLSHLFTTDPTVVAAIQSCALLQLLCYLVSPVVHTLDGVLLARQKVRYFAAAQSVGLGALMAAVVGLRTVFPAISGLRVVWGATAVHLTVQLLLHIAPHLWQRSLDEKAVMQRR